MSANPLPTEHPSMRVFQGFSPGGTSIRTVLLELDFFGVVASPQVRDLASEDRKVRGAAVRDLEKLSRIHKLIHKHENLVSIGITSSRLGHQFLQIVAEEGSNEGRL